MILGLRKSSSAALAAILFALAAGSLLAGSAPASRTGDTAAPQRIVSLNLCADQYLIALADRAQIAGLTRNANNAAMSAAAAQTRGLPILTGSAEEVLAIDPDLVIGAPARRGGMMAALSGAHYHTLDLKPAGSYTGIVTQIRAVAKAVGHVDRGEALIAGMDRDLAAIARPRRSGVAAYYQRRGFLTGTGTLIDDLMTRAGLVNLAGKLGKPVLSQLTLEELMVAQPDYLLIESGSEHVVDLGTEMLRHPLLKDIKRLRLPQAWTVCGGPAYVDAVRSLVNQIDHRL
ncbi:ABC transporter substrate-binding protein [Sphingobium sp. 3R8]|uniref:ABC transporter substrate-binding protein n=1 Tax=Sphingobium sp. 3R8 TaxID=2874921 RepID=UPI001CCD92F2|nr:ABC transporter substrate-binding protein [Sphingobium sp. 3R8]MBZ9646681.1 ABC transporter substrate-binding protein [Sphingobium sp. 3R8]